MFLTDILPVFGSLFHSFFSMLRSGFIVWDCAGRNIILSRNKSDRALSKYSGKHIDLDGRVMVEEVGERSEEFIKMGLNNLKAQLFQVLEYTDKYFQDDVLKRRIYAELLDCINEFCSECSQVLHAHQFVFLEKYLNESFVGTVLAGVTYQLRQEISSLHRAV